MVAIPPARSLFLVILSALLAAIVTTTPVLAQEHQPGGYDFRLPTGTSKTQMEQWIRQASKKYGLDPSLVRAVMEIESAGDPSAVSPKGAQGLMQIMPGTAKDLKLADPFDPWSSIDAGSRYLSQQLKDFGDVRLALAAYNAGPEAVRRAAGIPPIPETQRYVEAVANRFIRLKTGGDLKAFVKKVLEAK